MIGVLKKLINGLRGLRSDPKREVPPIKLGNCESCGRSFEYDLFHCGFGDMAYAYCDRCGQTALLSGWYKHIPEGAHLQVHHAIEPRIEPYLQSCACGGAFRADATPRCPHCKV